MDKPLKNDTKVLLEMAAFTRRVSEIPVYDLNRHEALILIVSLVRDAKKILEENT